MLTDIELGWARNLIEYLNENMGPDRIQVDDIKLIDCNGDNVAIVGWDSSQEQYGLLEAPRT